MLNIEIPEFAMVMLVGTAGSGKTTFARRFFKNREVLSSDEFRAMVADDENDQDASPAAFEILHMVAKRRLINGLLTVIDATNLTESARTPLLEMAAKRQCPVVAVVFDLPLEVCRARNAGRVERRLDDEVVREHYRLLQSAKSVIEDEAFHEVVFISSADILEEISVTQTLSRLKRYGEEGPFDIIGDIHGCMDELSELLKKLGYLLGKDGKTAAADHPDGRKVIFLGDLVDRGPDVPGVLRLVMNMVRSGNALCVPGNHDFKLMIKLQGRDVPVRHGLAESLAQMENESEAWKREVADFIEDLAHHLILDNGKLVVAHAGMTEKLMGKLSGKARSFALYGQTTGETDTFGLPIRYNWAAEYGGEAMIVYGHTPVPEPVWLNNTICLDTGCVYGGRLTALRYPERELVSVPAARVYCKPVKPI